jgi:hypothetical protein
VAASRHDWAAGRDPLFETAIRLAVSALEQRLPAVPRVV